MKTPLWITSVSVCRCMTIPRTRMIRLMMICTICRQTDSFNAVINPGWIIGMNHFLRVSRRERWLAVRQNFLMKEAWNWFYLFIKCKVCKISNTGSFRQMYNWVLQERGHRRTKGANSSVRTVCSSFCFVAGRSVCRQCVKEIPCSLNLVPKTCAKTEEWIFGVSIRWEELRRMKIHRGWLRSSC